MKTDKFKTKVVFLIDAPLENEENKSVFAFFPELLENNNCALSYAHIGQHSECSFDYAKECLKANESDYNDLKKELESCGYNLEVCESF